MNSAPLSLESIKITIRTPLSIFTCFKGLDAKHRRPWSCGMRETHDHDVVSLNPQCDILDYILFQMLGFLMGQPRHIIR